MRFAILVSLVAVAGCVDVDDVDDLSQPVISGDETPQGLFPATGALINNGLVSCTGTLISPAVVLTAAHCVDPFFVDGIPSFTLELNGNAAGLQETVPGQAMYAHPEFSLFENPAPGVGQWFDIGLVVLEEPIYDVAYEVIPSPAEAQRILAVDTPVDIVGYGLTELDDYDFGLKTHGQAILREVGDHELFLGRSGEQQNCNGDSGGPAIIDVGTGRRVVGVVSRAPDNDPVCDHGGIDTRVDPYLDWIAETVPEICEDINCDGGELELPDDGGCSVGSTRTSANGMWLLLAVAALVRRRRR